MSQIFSLFYETFMLSLAPEIIGAVGAGLVLEAVIQILAFKHRQLLPQHCFLKLPLWLWITCCVLGYSVALSALFYGTYQLEPAQGYYSAGFQRLLKDYPCLGAIGDAPNLYALADGGSQLVTCCCILFVCFMNCSLAAFFSLHSLVLLYTKQSHASLKTQKLQRLMLPFICLASPWFYFTLATVFKIGISIGLNDVLMACFCSHGLLNSISIMLIYRPYRMETFLIITK
ncbi:unnamed protein product, partial [Mesorhabditis spiculigera]